MTRRPDLLSLDDDALIVLANRGLLKRAKKDLARGEAPRIEVRDDGAVIGRFSDATATLAPEVPFRQTECTCGATRVCRHRVATVLAYQAENQGHEAPAALPALEIDDPMLRARLGARTFAAALRSRTRGYSATVRLTRPPVVLLPTCTVTFLVPWDLAHVRCDCVDGVDCEHVAMAIWALRAADPSGEEELIEVNAGVERRGQPVIDDLLGLCAELVRGGWAGALAGVKPRVADLRARLDREHLVWLTDVVDSLMSALDDCESGLVSADAARCSDLIAELGVRCRARPSARVPRAHLHGEGVAGATQLDRVVLHGLGARYRVRGRVGQLSLFFRESKSDDALVLERRWTVDDGARPPSGPEIGKRRLVGTPAGALATSNITTHGARREPNRVIKVSSRRMQTSIVPGTGSRLEPITDYRALRDRLAQRPPATLSPRVRAWRVVVLALGEVEAAGYDPGTRTVWGVLVDPSGGRAIAASEWLPEAPAGPGLLGRALLSGARTLTAEASLRRGALWLEPLAIRFDDLPVAVDLHEDVELPSGLPPATLPHPDDPLARTIAEVRAWLREICRRGVSHLTGAHLDQGRAWARRLGDTGLVELAGAVRALTEASEDRVAAWHTATTRAALLGHLLARAE